MKKVVKKHVSLVISITLILCTPFIASANQYSEEDPLLSDLNKLSLPSEPITEFDLPEIESTIQTALGQITEYIEFIHKIRFRDKKVRPRLLGKAEKDIDQPPLIVGLLYFEDWLIRQGCVYDVSMPLSGASGQYAAFILTSCPGQLPVTVSFYMKNQMPKEFDLSLYVGPASLKFAHLSEMDE